MSKRYTAQDVEEAKEDLLKLIQEGDNLFFVIRSVSKSGMSRKMSLFIATKDWNNKTDLRNITWFVARILDKKWYDDLSIKVDGCGMNMCAYVATRLSRALFDKDYALEERTL